ncbi:MAG: hypothetical protein ACYDAG_14685, partial [Chloroflexota bacterium]
MAQVWPPARQDLWAGGWGVSTPRQLSTSQQRVLLHGYVLGLLLLVAALGSLVATHPARGLLEAAAPSSLATAPAPAAIPPVRRDVIVARTVAPALTANTASVQRDDFDLPGGVVLAMDTPGLGSLGAASAFASAP